MTDFVLELKSVSKYFPGVQALDDVDFSINRGEIHALVGQNGAGKSTLLKILSGVYHADQGSLYLDGEVLQKWTPKEIIDNGIAFIYQELNLVQSLSVAQNIYISREPKNFIGIIDWKIMRDSAKKALVRIGVHDIDPLTRLDKLTVAKQQLVAIARAINMNPKILILDEPTSRLGGEDVENLFGVLKEMRNSGLSIIYVSHRLNEIYQIADRITVLRDGKKVATELKENILASELVKHMVGEELFDKNYHSHKELGEVCFEAEDLSLTGNERVNFKLHKNEVLGLVGAVGSGKTETVRAIFGIDRMHSGVLKTGNKKLRNHNATRAINVGIALCPEDRKYQGLILDDSIQNNITLAGLRNISKYNLFINPKNEKHVGKRQSELLRIVTPSIKRNARSLSGGNQQKVVLAKWLSTDANMFIFDEPTIGVDVQGKAEIYDLIHDLAENGSAILFVTSDTDEAFSVCDRILVMFGGQIVAELDTRKTTKEEIAFYVMGGSNVE